MMMLWYSTLDGSSFPQFSPLAPVGSDRVGLDSPLAADSSFIACILGLLEKPQSANVPPFAAYLLASYLEFGLHLLLGLHPSSISPLLSVALGFVFYCSQLLMWTYVSAFR